MGEPSKPTHIPTRYALIKRAQKMVKEIDEYFSDAESFGLSYAEADPDGIMQNMRKAFIDMLIREQKIKINGTRP